MRCQWARYHSAVGVVQVTVDRLPVRSLFSLFLGLNEHIDCSISFASGQERRRRLDSTWLCLDWIASEHFAEAPSMNKERKKSADHLGAKSKSRQKRDCFATMCFVLRLRLLAIGLVEHPDQCGAIHDVSSKDCSRVYRQLQWQEKTVHRLRHDFLRITFIQWNVILMAIFVDDLSQFIQSISGEFAVKRRRWSCYWEENTYVLSKRSFSKDM